MELAWVADRYGWTSSVLAVRTPDRDDLSMRLEGRIQFAVRSWTWESPTEEVPAYEVVELDLGSLDELRFDARQIDWLSEVSVQVVVLDGEGRTLMRRAAPPLMVVWDAYGAILLEPVEAAELSIDGAWSAVAMAEVAASAGAEEFVVEYGKVTQ